MLIKLLQFFSSNLIHPVKKNTCKLSLRGEKKYYWGHFYFPYAGKYSAYIAKEEMYFQWKALVTENHPVIDHLI